MADEKEQEVEPESPDIHFDPIVKLSLVETKTLEEEEDALLTIRAKLFRYDVDEETDEREWKERGTGNVKILKHRQTGFIRILMRRDKTLKLCANHYIYPSMELKPNCGSDRAWVWTTTADYADEVVKEEVLAIRFANSENANKFKQVFDESAEEMKKTLQIQSVLENGDKDADTLKEEKDTISNKKKQGSVETSELTSQLGNLKVSNEVTSADTAPDKPQTTE